MISIDIKGNKSSKSSQNIILNNVLKDINIKLKHR